LVVVVVVVWVLLVAAAAVLELVVVVVVVLAFCRVALGLFRFAEVASRTADEWLTRLVGFLPRGNLHCARRLFRHGFACMLKHRPPAGAARTRRKPLLG
jgi:hypothetical protein